MCQLELPIPKARRSSLAGTLFKTHPNLPLYFPPRQSAVNMKNIRSNDVITSQAAHIEAGHAATEWLSIKIQE
jgi:hypothetical protein